MNFLERLIAEWYQYKGYFVKQNVRVGKRKNGGHAGEIDVVAFHPVTKHLIHLEMSSDTASWSDRETKFEKKFRVSREHIPALFEGFEIDEIDQCVVLLYGSKTKKSVGGIRLILIADIMQEIYDEFENKKLLNGIVPENLALIRTLHVFISTIKKINT
jgi:hypothetical protein